MFPLSPLFLWCLIFWSLLEAKDIAWQLPNLSRGSLPVPALPVPGMVGEKPHSHWARAERSLIDNCFHCFAETLHCWTLYATEHYFCLIAALSKIAWDHLRQCWNRNSGSAGWSLVCSLSMHFRMKLKDRKLD